MAENPTYEELEDRIQELEQSESKHKRMEKVLRESEERYRQIFDIAPAGIYEVDFRTSKLVDANDAICEYSGYTKGELLSMNGIDLLSEESQKRFLNRISKVLSGASVPDTVDYEIIRKDGSVIWVGIHNRFLYEGENIVGATVVAFDITERKRIEEALLESEQKFRALVNTAPYGIQLTDWKGKITFGNPAHHAILGYADGELIGKYIWDLIADDENKIRTKNYYANLIKNQPSPEVYYNKNRTKDGRLVDVQINWDYVRNASGKVDGTISIVHDITERKRLEEGLKNKAQKLEELNIALNVLLKKRENDKTDLEEHFVNNIEKMVLPYIDKIEGITQNANQNTLLDILRRNLTELTSAFPKNLSSKEFSLTRTEIKVANFIRHGKRTKEIASILNITKSTVKNHRHKIRTKIGIANKKVNLRSYLLSLR